MDEELSVLVIMPEAPGLPPLALWQEFNQLNDIAGIKVELVANVYATRSRIAAALRKRHDVVIWSGHGAPNRLITADGSSVDGEWLATQARCGAPVALVLAACLSGASDEDLKGIAELVSRNGVNAIGMMVAVQDTAAITYNVSFVEAMVAKANIGRAHDVARKAMKDKDPTSAQGAVLFPALSNGYRDDVDWKNEVDARLGAVERKIDMLLDRKDSGR